MTPLQPAEEWQEWCACMCLCVLMYKEIQLICTAESRASGVLGWLLIVRTLSKRSGQKDYKCYLSPSYRLTCCNQGIKAVKCNNDYNL